jgi:hypothetical protein
MLFDFFATPGFSRRFVGVFAENKTLLSFASGKNLAPLPLKYSLFFTLAPAASNALAGLAMTRKPPQDALFPLSDELIDTAHIHTML